MHPTGRGSGVASHSRIDLVIMHEEAPSALTLQADGAPDGQRGQRAVLSLVCDLCEQGGNGGKTTASRRGTVSRVN